MLVWRVLILRWVSGRSGLRISALSGSGSMLRFMFVGRSIVSRLMRFV